MMMMMMMMMMVTMIKMMMSPITQCGRTVILVCPSDIQNEQYPVWRFIYHLLCTNTHTQQLQLLRSTCSSYNFIKGGLKIRERDRGGLKS